jgi:hypothetical protein
MNDRTLCDHLWTVPYNIKSRLTNSSFLRALPEIFSGGAANAGANKFSVTCHKKCINCNRVIQCRTQVRDSSLYSSPRRSKLDNAKWSIVQVIK